jgi:uncharacterized repeat protein (TIGR01451 family)
MKTGTNHILIALLIVLTSAGLAYAAADLKATYNPQRNTVLLSWEPIAGAASYNVYKKTAGQADYQRINFSAVNDRIYADDKADRRSDSLYLVRGVGAGGTEVGETLSVGAPLMTINVAATVTTNRTKPITERSIKTGKLVTFAGPGDIITYKIIYANRGVSSAKNISINYDIPAGTTIAGTPIVRKGYSCRTTYYDQKQRRWLARIEKEENINKVKFEITDPVPPVAGEQDVNGVIDLNVMIGL